VKASEFFRLPPSLARFSQQFSPEVPPWEWLKCIKPALAALPEPTDRPVVPAAVHLEGRVWIDPTVTFTGPATIIGPAYIGARTEIKPGAFIRGQVIIGEGCVIGNSCEYKNCLLMDDVKSPHYNYVGDSILGNHAHLGAGVICSNLRLDQREVRVRIGAATESTGLRKFGAILGDSAEVGCNSVLNPGTLLGPRAVVGPAMAFSGYLPAGQMARLRLPIVIEPRRD
jgi:UDP-N-acetylglucosamine diphosphorylase / glucose-1-phosphate thymidylyltransferase / UDP-N-acetylgalactosamine diphosphorylase / glucosamine-1-phosphate N-acetyltransferase / galactosamine-1-phosphate N-acetyltransferase